MPSVVFNIHFVGVAPSKTMIFGFIKRICVLSHSSQADISSGKGTRLFGGRHLTTLVIYTSFLSISAAFKICVRSCPALPTKGRPCASSSAPGPSPMNINEVFSHPSPKTTELRVLERGQDEQRRARFLASSQIEPDTRAFSAVERENKILPVQLSFPIVRTPPPPH